MGKKRDYGGSENSPDACFGGLGQSPATASSIDYIVQQNAFVMDLESHDASSTGCGGKPCRDTAPWGADDALIERIFSQSEPQQPGRLSGAPPLNSQRADTPTLAPAISSSPHALTCQP